MTTRTIHVRGKLSAILDWNYMNESIHAKLDRLNPEQQKPVLAVYLREQLIRRRSSPEESQEIAYEIAGLLSTELASSLDENDPYLEILLMAGQLELPVSQHDGVNWKQLTERIQALPH
jgi:hypothetical protein